MNIALHAFEPEDFDRLIEWVDSPELLLAWAGNFFTWPLDAEQCRAYWETAQGPQASRVIFKAVDADRDRVVGHIELDGFDWENGSAFLSRVLVGRDALRGQGAGRHIVARAVQYAFDHSDLHRLSVTVLDSNLRAQRCYERAGFRREGLLRDVVRIGDRHHCLVAMSLLRPEWQGALPA